MTERLTYANVVTVLALLAVIAGGTAAALPGKNSVQANDLRKNSVKAKAVAKDAVRSGEIKDGVVNSQEVADRGLSYNDLASNSVVARIRNTAPVSTAGATSANPAIVPLDAPQWQQAGTETHVLFGEYRATLAADCGSGSLNVQALVDGEVIEDFSATEDPGAFTRPVFAFRQYFMETGAARAHTMAFRIWDTCSTAASFTMDFFGANVVAMR